MHLLFNSMHYKWVRVRVMVLNATFKIFQLCRGGQFYWWRKHEWLEKTIDLSQVTLSQMLNRVYFATMNAEL